MLLEKDWPIFPDVCKEQIREGRWTIEERADENIFLIKTEPYSQCCNPKGQTIFWVNKEGGLIKQETGIK